LQTTIVSNSPMLSLQRRRDTEAHTTARNETNAAIGAHARVLKMTLRHAAASCLWVGIS
jgi:hypothetical protein